MICPLCESEKSSFFFEFKKKDYYRCTECHLIFLPEQFHVKDQDEKEIYGRHENSPEDLRYRGFLSRLFDPLKNKLNPESRGLDFGSGPGPTLSIMLEEVGHKMSIYDKFFACDESAFNQDYDFITATEVFEHLRKPKFEIERLLSCLKPGGYLGVMTKLATDKERFATWHYKNDPTHIIFFSEKTFKWLGRSYNLELEFFGADVIIMKKKI